MEKPPRESFDHKEPLSPELAQIGETSKLEPVIVEFEGNTNPSYVELDGSGPALFGEDEGPCQVAISAAAHGVRSIRKTITQAGLTGST